MIPLTLFRHYEQNRAPLGLYLHAAWFVRSGVNILQNKTI